MKVLVTGANGFVGRAVCRAFLESGYKVRGAVRSQRKISCLEDKIEPWLIGEIGPETDWSKALEGIDAIVHLAARVHVMKEASADPLAEYRKINTSGTRKLAEAVAGAGVKRMIFLSTIKVNGEKADDRPFTEEDTPCPIGCYALSKWEAEKALSEISRATGLEVVIIRPPLVYGPGVGGNFLRLLYLVNKGTYLPLGLVDNQRSFIYLKNLTSTIIACLKNPKAANQTFLVSDDHDLPTAEMIGLLSSAMDKKARLLPVPVIFLKIAARLIGKTAEVERLVSSLQIDCSKIKKILDWKPPFTVREGVGETVRWFRKNEL